MMKIILKRFNVRIKGSVFGPNSVITVSDKLAKSLIKDGNAAVLQEQNKTIESKTNKKEAEKEIDLEIEDSLPSVDPAGSIK